MTKGSWTGGNAKAITKKIEHGNNGHEVKLGIEARIMYNGVCLKVKQIIYRGLETEQHVSVSIYNVLHYFSSILALEIAHRTG